MALSALERAPEAQSLSLQSFLILPMQHVTRLPLLVDVILHQLLDVQRGKTEDCAAVGRCLETLHTVGSCCRCMSDYELLRFLVEVPSCDVYHY